MTRREEDIRVPNDTFVLQYLIENLSEKELGFALYASVKTKLLFAQELFHNKFKLSTEVQNEISNILKFFTEMVVRLKIMKNKEISHSLKNEITAKFSTLPEESTEQASNQNHESENGSIEKIETQPLTTEIIETINKSKTLKQESNAPNNSPELDRQITGRPKTPSLSPHVVLIHSKSLRRSALVRNELINKINIKNKDLKINKIKLINGNKILVDVASENDLEKLSVEIKKHKELTDDFILWKPKKLKPRIILYKIDENIKKDELKEELIIKNYIFKEDNFTVDFPIRVDGANHWVITVEPDLFKEVIVKQQVYLGWRVIYLREFKNIKLCEKCGCLGHTVNKCTSYCLKCYHEVCTCNVRICMCCYRSNCYYDTDFCVDHRFKDRMKCNVYIKQLDIHSEYVDYGD